MDYILIFFFFIILLVLVIFGLPIGRTSFNDEIKNIQWAKDYEHVIFSVGSQMKIIEIDPRDHRNCMDLPKTTSETPLIGYNLAQERLYFVDNSVAFGHRDEVALPPSA